MKFNVLVKLSATFFVLALLSMNFYGINFGTAPEAARAGGKQPYNSFKQYIWGGVGEDEDSNYGWNISYIENLNGDAYPDLVVGAPGHDSTYFEDVGAAYIFYGKANSGFDDLNYSKADVAIYGDGLNNRFGWDVADAGDMNNDGLNDLIVGAPGALNNRGRAFIFYGGTIPGGSFSASSCADRILDGLVDGGYYGTAVAGVGDINKDDYGDVLVGAPNADQIIITYGYKNKVTINPNLWDDNLSTPGIVDFSKGVNNYVNETYTDNNTWGLDGDDDGWDWTDILSDPVYGGDAAIDMCTHYASWEADGPDADGLTWGNRTSLEVTIGRNHTDYNPYGFDTSGYDPDASAAWGIEFNITDELYDYISSNSTITIAFDYGAVDTNAIYSSSNLSKYLAYSIRSRIWNNSGKYYLGNEIVGNQINVFYKKDPTNTPPWGPIYRSFEWDITEYIDGIGSYYWDFGCFLDQFWAVRADSGMMAFFDNITMKIINEKSVIIVGQKNSGFGTALEGVGDINDDGYPDMLIGAPDQGRGYAALLPGKERYKNIDSINLATTILTGKNHGDRFGYSLGKAGDVDNDGKTDIIIGAPGGNYAHLYYGSTLNVPPIVPDLWERDEERGTPHIEFDSGLKTTGNTPGIAGADDGWDVWNGVYGSGGTAGSAVKYNGADTTDSNQVAADDELIIAIGGTLGGGGWSGAKPDSGAYGVKFSITPEMVTALESGCDAVLSYDWRFENHELDQDDTIWLKTFIRSTTENLALGWNLDKDAGDNENKDNSNETYWATLPEDLTSVFIQKCSECFSNAGSYYLDIGAKLREYYWISGGVYEDGVFNFDNVYLRINPAPDIRFVGPAFSGFGASVVYCNNLHINDNGDI